MLTTLGAVLIPLGVAGVLWVLPGHPTWAVSLVGCVFLSASFAVRPGLTHRPCQPFAAWPLRISKGFWKQGAYFAFDGMGETLRGAVFVAGTMLVLNSLLAFNVATALSSALSAAALWWIARRQTHSNRLFRLALALTLSALAWVALAVSLRYAAAFSVYLALYSFSIPILQATKHMSARAIQSMPSSKA